MRTSRYTPTHAFVASGILVCAVLSKGVGVFWKQFVHGLTRQLTPKEMLDSFGGMTVFFGTLLIAFWASTHVANLCGRKSAPDDSPPTPPRRLKSVLFALEIAPPVILVALGLNVLGAHAIEWISGVRPADQELVKCFVDPAYSLGFRLVLIAGVLFQAPLLEEPLFRGIIFRGFAKKLPLAAALGLSGFVFALVHVNAASFVALWYLGIAFAGLYARTRTILAPMTLHCVFNATNLVLLFLFPDLAS